MALAHESESPALTALGQSSLVLDALPRAVVVADLDGTILAWNAVARRVYGTPGGDAVGRSLLEFFAEGSTTEVRKIVDLVREGETWSGAVPVVQPGGDVTWTYALVAPLRDEDGTVVGLVGATDEAQSEVRVLQRRASDLSEHLVLALAAGELGTWHWHLATGVTEWDNTMERIFGLEPGTFDGTFDMWVSLLHPDDVDETLATLDHAVANKSAYQVEHRVIWPDGTVHWLQGRGTVTLDADGNVTGTIGCTSDITARKRLELEADAAVRTSRRRGEAGAVAPRAARVPGRDQSRRSRRQRLPVAHARGDRGRRARARRLVHASFLAGARWCT